MPRSENRFVLLMSAAVLCFAGGCCSQGSADACNRQGSLLRHVVLIEFKETTTKGQIEETERMFCAMASGIEEIKDYEWGTNVGDVDRTGGFTHCFVLTFVSEGDRDRYMSDAAHNELRTATRPYIKKMLVLDYWKREN